MVVATAYSTEQAVGIFKKSQKTKKKFRVEFFKVNWEPKLTFCTYILSKYCWKDLIPHPIYLNVLFGTTLFQQCWLTFFANMPESCPKDVPSDDFTTHLSSWVLAAAYPWKAKKKWKQLGLSVLVLLSTHAMLLSVYATCGNCSTTWVLYKGHW